MRFTTPLLLLSTLIAPCLSLPESKSTPTPPPTNTGSRPCGFKIAPCPPETPECQKIDPTCTRGENCQGTCVSKHPSSLPPPPPPSSSTS
ncbi:hypothetical protein EJ08DRAFT_644913 [Tothia fuscella]|uniref:WAP domain-containing protein n=1 Tax=Tothia fuscella TaxID=1048955 RepID=A0A9P4U441_9PEZI|nr:hypothetical protein EJ08DRAFT_644913 [Tothia fuscella]